MARYCSAQDNVRTRQYRETIRVNVLHGRKSMSWAKSVLPLFTGTSSETFRKVPDRVQIDTTLNRQNRVQNHPFIGRHRLLNRTAVLPYMKFIEEPAQPYIFMLRDPMTQDSEFITRENNQPIYKLHGSYNWFAEPHGERLVVMGGNKTASIGAFRVLARYQDEFRAMLSQPDTHLMVIGYGFGDPHINSAIQTAATKGLRMFIVDALGVDVIDKRNTRAQIPEPVTDLMQALMPRIIGASRRPLNEMINSDPVENEKVMRFFAGQAHIVRIAPEPTPKPQ